MHHFALHRFLSALGLGLGLAFATCAQAGTSSAAASASRPQAARTPAMTLGVLERSDYPAAACGTYYMRGDERPDSAAPVLFVSQDQKLVARIGGQRKTAELQEMQPHLKDSPNLTPGDRVRFLFAGVSGFKVDIDTVVREVVVDDLGAYPLVEITGTVLASEGREMAPRVRLKGYDLCL